MSVPETATDLPPFDPDRAAAYLRDGLWGPRTVGDALRDSRGAAAPTAPRSSPRRSG